MSSSPGDELTPIVDAAFPDPVFVSGELLRALRATELRARGLLKRCDAAAEVEPYVVLTQARAELECLLRDRQRSALFRLTRRPVAQLQPDSLARKSFQRITTGMFERTTRALALRADLLEARSTLASIRARYGSRLPGLTARHLEHARVTEARLAAVRTVADLSSMRERLSRVEEILESYLGEFAPDDVSSIHVLTQTASSGEMTMPELRAVLLVSLKQRSALQQVSSSRAALATLAMQQVSQLESVARDGERVASNAHALLEQLAMLAASRGRAGMLGVSEAPFWTGAFAAAHNASFPRQGRFAWYPPTGVMKLFVPAPREGEGYDMRDEALFFVIPLLGGYSYITRMIPSTVRVWSRTIREGAIIECLPASQSGQTMRSGQLAEADIEPFFSGLQSGKARCYGTATRARLRVLFSDERGGWFARLEQRGRLDVIAEAEWNAQAASAGSFRILLEESGTPEPEEIADGDHDLGHAVQPQKTVETFLGMDSLLVTTALAKADNALLRSPATRTKTGETAARRELELFRTLSQEPTAGLCGPASAQPIGLGRLPRARIAWPVYRLPLAVPLDRMPVARDWLRENDAVSLQFIRGVAKLIRAVHDSGFVLGSCHERMFAIGARWPDLDRAPVPVPALIAAPLCARTGEAFASLAWANRAYQDRYSMLGLPALLPDVEAGSVARLQVDAEAFALFVLDLLATEMAGAADPGQSIYVPEVRQRLRRLRYRNTSLAERILTIFASPQDRPLLLGMLASLANNSQAPSV